MEVAIADSVIALFRGVAPGLLGLVVTLALVDAVKAIL